MSFSNVSSRLHQMVAFLLHVLLCSKFSPTTVLAMHAECLVVLDRKHTKFLLHFLQLRIFCRHLGGVTISDANEEHQ